MHQRRPMIAMAGATSHPGPGTGGGSVSRTSSWKLQVPVTVSNTEPLPSLLVVISRE